MKKLFTLIAIMCCTVAVMADSDVTAEKAAQNTPDGWTAVELPNIPSTCTTVTVTGLSESGTPADNAAAIQAVLNNVSSTTGTMVVIPAGTYLCNPISIRVDKTILHLSAGTTLKLAPFAGYDTSTNTFNTPSATQYPETGRSSAGVPTYANFINNLNSSGSSATRNDIIIEGEGATSIIEGQGGPWWDAVETVSFSRPSLIRLTKGSRFLFRNFKMQNAPGTNLTLGMSGGANNMTVHDVTISNPASIAADPSHNTDGIPVWGPYVNIYDCNISTGDDNVVVDSNTSYCHAWNITCGAGHGMSIGSYTVGVNHIIYEDITFNNTETGIRIKTSNDRSGNSYSGTSTNGAVSDLIFRNITMTGVLQPIVLTEVYDVDKEDPSQIASSDVTATTPEFCNILFQNIKSTGTAYSSHFKYGAPIYIYGRPESYIHDITFDNVSVEAQKGMFLAYCKDIHFINKCVISPATTSGSYKATWDGDITGGLVTLDATTYDATATSGTTWAYGGGYTITNGNNKSYAASATAPYVKYSAGTEFTINIPEGKYVEGIKFKGFDNYTEGDSYIAELNGKTYGSTDYVFPLSQDVKSYDIDFGSTVSGTLKFKISGKQTCLSITLKTTDTPTGIKEVKPAVTPIAKKMVKVFRNGQIMIGDYNIAGQRVK